MLELIRLLGFTNKMCKYNDIENKLDAKKTGKFIKDLRIKEGYSQYKLAYRINISRQAVSKWERGITIPSRESLLKLSDLFNISINEFIK